MVKIPYIKIPSVRVGSIGPASNIGAGGATPAPPSPSPITYLTQWKIVGNSEVHTDPYLTSWKVSGNSVVDNNTILSCGDLGQDGKYHVKISNGVTIFDIALTEPLRKVNDVSDTIEFPSSTEGKALVTRKIGNIEWNDVVISKGFEPIVYFSVWGTNVKMSSNNILSSIYPTYDYNVSVTAYNGSGIGGQGNNPVLRIVNENMNNFTVKQFRAANANVDIIYELATPITELVDAPQIAVSPTDTYTSANATPYSAFEHTENKEIWSCGEYNPIDGKYHILVQPQGGHIADIALTEPLRKVNDVADIIEFPSETEGKALVTRNIAELSVAGNVLSYRNTNKEDEWRWNLGGSAKGTDYQTIGNIICSNYNSLTSLQTFARNTGIGIEANGIIVLFDKTYNQKTDKEALEAANANTKYIFELDTPTTELVDAPQIAEADSYSCIISPDGKAVSWSEFLYTLNYLLTDSENNILVDSENYQLTVQS